MISLFTFLQAVHPLTTDLRNHLEQVVKEKYIAKKRCLLKEGSICREIYFVEKGMLRNYYIQGANTITSAFTRENEICTSSVSFFSQQPGIEYIEALED